jgi:hypothetical protein
MNKKARQTLDGLSSVKPDTAYFATTIFREAVKLPAVSL